MGRLAAILGALIGALLVPLALVAPTWLLLVPAHLMFTALAAAAAVGEGLAGRAERARRWGFGHLVATIVMIGALELGIRVEGGRLWLVPWVLVLLWGWVPMAVGGVAGWAGDRIRERRSNRAVKRRKQALVP